MQDTTNPALTQTEQIAVALFAWKRIEKGDLGCYYDCMRSYRKGAPDFVAILTASGEIHELHGADWPTFTGPTAWDWVRKMEDALDQHHQGAHGLYCQLLSEAYTGMNYTSGSNLTPDWYSVSRATIPQRLAAACAVLREVGK